MMTGLGLALILAPLLLLPLWRNQAIGACHILLGVVALHAAVGIGMQGAGAFTYPVVALIHGVVALAVGVTIWRAWPYYRDSLRTLYSAKGAIGALVLVLSILALSTVHFSYTGDISTPTDARYTAVENMVYPYPYFTDEWYSVAFINDSIEYNRLPLYNPITREQSRFANPKVVFHATFAEIFLLLKLPALTWFSIISIIANAILVGVCYLFLRELGDKQRLTPTLTRTLAAVGALSILYITASGNLPTVWTLTPMTVALIVWVAGWLLLVHERLGGTTLAGLVVFIFYPPLAVFYIAGLVPIIWQRLTQNPAYTRHIIAWGGGGVIALGGLLLALLALGTEDVTTAVGSKLWFQSYITPAEPTFSIWMIVPIWMLLAAPFGLTAARRYWWMLIPTVLALGWWALYAGTDQRLLISYPRVVFLGAFLTTLAGGLGVMSIARRIYNDYPAQAHKPLVVVASLALVVFIIATPFYTQGDSWKALRKINPEERIAYMPAAPANRYYTERDQELFADIANKTFLALPWKGTVLGVASDNYPVVVKGGTIGGGKRVYERFMSGDCGEKKRLARQHSIDYVYTLPFSCPMFTRIGANGDLVLYRTNHNES